MKEVKLLATSEIDTGNKLLGKFNSSSRLPLLFLACKKNLLPHFFTGELFDCVWIRNDSNECISISSTNQKDDPI